MHLYEVRFHLDEKAHVYREEQRANSEMEARRLVEARYAGANIRIIGVSRIN